VRVLTGLRAAGLPVAVVHVAERAGAPASTASVSGAESAELRHALSAAGVRYIGVGRHDDLRAALSGRPESRYAGVR